MYADDGKARRGTYRFVHASDLHLDAPVRGIATAPATLRTALRDASLRAWQSLVELAIARQAAFVVIAGGVFGGDPPTVRACVALRDGLQRLRAHAIDVLIALADSDGTSAALVPWLSDATVFASDRIDTARVVRDGQCLAALHGASAGRADALELARAIRPLGEGVQIGVLPCAPDAARDSSDRFGTTALSSTALHYWAVGGARARAVVHEDPWIVRAGTPQGHSLEPDEVGPKGCVIVEVAAGRIASVTPAACDHVRFLSLRVDVTQCADMAALRQGLLRALDRAVGGERATLAEAVLDGPPRAGVAPDRLALEAALLGELRATCATWAAPVWWARVRDLTARAARPGSVSPWDLRRILTEQSEALGAPLAGSTFLARIFAPLLRQWNAETDLAAQRELVRDAAALALDRLEGDGTP